MAIAAADSEFVQTLRQRIRDQADAAGPDGWLEMSVDGLDRPTLRVPRGAFEQWAIGYAQAPGVADWETISPMGLKQGFDDPLHTDWMLGAGLALDIMKTNGAFSDSIYRARHDVERRLLHREASVLLNGPSVGEGVAIRPAGPDDMDCLDRAAAASAHPVLVLPDLRPEWLPLVLASFEDGGAVIAARGGAMAHLVTEARATGRGAILRVDDACELYSDGALLRVEPDAGEIVLSTDDDYRLARLAGAQPAVASRAVRPVVPAGNPPSPGARHSGFGMSLSPAAAEVACSYAYLIPAGGFDIPGIGSFRGALHADGENLMGEEHGVLLVHGFEDGGSCRRLGTAASPPRTWKSGDAARAIREGARLICPDMERELEARRQLALAAKRQRLEKRAVEVKALHDDDLLGELRYMQQQRQYIEEAISDRSDFYIGGNRFEDLRYTRDEIDVHSAEVERRGLAVPEIENDAPEFIP